MSRENVETLRGFYEAFNRQDFDDAMRFVEPEVELHPGIATPDQDRRYVGRGGLMEFFRGAIEPWESATAEAAETIEVPDNRILVVERWLFSGRDGIEIDRELQSVFTFRKGLIARIDGFTDKTEALEAAGLRE